MGEGELGAKAVEVAFGPWRETIRGIRFAVFVEEQKVPPELEMDAWDDRSRHVVGYVDGQAVATGRLLPDGHIGRVAVLATFRGRGAGEAVMRQLLSMARESGFEKALLSSQTHAIGFYERLGFRPVGEVYWDAGIEHLDMELDLRGRA